MRTLLVAERERERNLFSRAVLCCEQLSIMVMNNKAHNTVNSISSLYQSCILIRQLKINESY